MKVLAAGNCNFDSSAIRKTFQSFPQVELVFCDSADEVWEVIAKTEFKLVLLNRVFDQTDERGIDLIRKIKTEMPQSPNLMLISNFDDAQAAAVAAGALPGFGKSALASESVRQQLAEALNQPAVNA
jgi:two-component system, chemotaxis family, chemotaxis protein CheY